MFSYVGFPPVFQNLTPTLLLNPYFNSNRMKVDLHFEMNTTSFYTQVI